MWSFCIILSAFGPYFAVCFVLATTNEPKVSDHKTFGLALGSAFFSRFTASSKAAKLGINPPKAFFWFINFNKSGLSALSIFKAMLFLLSLLSEFLKSPATPTGEPGKNKGKSFGIEFISNAPVEEALTLLPNAALNADSNIPPIVPSNAPVNPSDWRLASPIAWGKSTGGLIFLVL